MRNKQQGVTLVELMIAVAIVAILAAIGYPSYSQYLLKGRRTAAQSFMYSVASKQEQVMLNRRQYFTVTDGTAAQWTDAKMSLPAEVTDYYTVKVTADNAATPPTFTISAEPKGSQLGDTKCGTIRLKHDGTKEKTGTGSVTDCWSK
jgi:type IV pilus assembly protein PilE